MLRALRAYLLPGLVFQSVVIAGGYGTGRELVEFFLTLGPIPGLIAMLAIAMVIWSLVAAMSFALAQSWGAYDYRSFFRALLGPGWVLFEICYLSLVVIALAVVGAAAGAIGAESFGLPSAAGVMVVLLAVAVLVFRGSGTIENVFSIWSIVLYGAFVTMLVWSFVSFGSRMVEAVSAGGGEGHWFMAGVRYASYNLAAIPAVLFAVRHVKTRRQAWLSGLFAGPVAMLPAALFYVAMLPHYPEIVSHTVPVRLLLERLGAPWFLTMFQLVLFGTLIETGAGLIHAVNERIAVVYAHADRSMPRAMRPGVAAALLGSAMLLSSVGLVDLIAKGYGTLTWGFLLVYVIPILTIGVWKLRDRRAAAG